MSEDSEQIRIQSEADEAATSDVVVQPSASDNDTQKEKPTTSDDNNPSTGDKDTDEGKTNDAETFCPHPLWNQCGDRDHCPRNSSGGKERCPACEDVIKNCPQCQVKVF